MLSAVRLTLSFLTKAERLKYRMLIAARVLSCLLDVCGIALIALIVAVAGQELEGSKPGAPAPAIAGFQVPPIDSRQLLWLAVFVLLVFTFKAVFASLLIRAQSRFVAAVETRNAKTIAEYILTGSLSNAKQYSKADLQFALTGSATFAFTGLLNNLASIITESFLLLLIAAAFFVVNPVAALFALVYFAIVVLVIQVWIGRSLKRAGREAADGTVESISGLSDALDTFREIFVLHKQEHFIDGIGESRARMARGNATMSFLGSMPRYVIETALILGVAILVAQQFASDASSSGPVTVGVFLAGGVRMLSSLIPLQNALANMKGNAGQAKTALMLLTRTHDADDVLKGERPADAPHPARPANEGGLSLVLDNVSYRHVGGDVDTIRGISMVVQPGAFVAIVGPSGAGKTTLVDLILGLMSPDRGSILLGGLEPGNLRSTSPGRIAYVPQKPGLVSGSIAENIALGVDEAEIDTDMLAKAVNAAHLREFVETRPGGLDASVGKSVDALSGGQIQRIGVARALYSQPQLLILDEATSGLDAASEAFISASLRELHGAVTVVVIAHRMSTVQHADEVFVIEEGRIAASGDFRTVLKHVPTVAEYVKLQSFAEEPQGR